MFIRALLVLSYIAYCIKLRAAPWKYFQLNAPYFNEQRNIFSKLDMDRLIPDQWKLEQFSDIGDQYPSRYPVFVKPEWGQNSQGIVRADNAKQLAEWRLNKKDTAINYLIQQAAPGGREYEVFIVQSDLNDDEAAIFSVTETINNSDERFPVNGIYNQATSYKDITYYFSPEQARELRKHLKKIGQFRISRFGLRADSIKKLLDGNFHIIEINLFFPMPLMLISKNVKWPNRFRFCFKCMNKLALSTKKIPSSQPDKAIFFTKLKQSKTLKHSLLLRPANEMSSNNEHP
ncbi:MAG: hypothetical protein ACJA0N_000616 [Pseudohongiellaceae bacterium]|jgi:hypothetical protein